MTAIRLFLSLLCLQVSLLWPGSVIGQKAQTSDQIEVYVFLGLDCPISQKYVPVLNRIYLSYSLRENLRWSFVVVPPEKQKMRLSFIEEYGVQFPIKNDDQHLSVAKRHQAKVTPEVIITRNGQIEYRGAIDNWFYELGKYRAQTTERYMINALDALLDGKVPTVAETQAIGCSISYREKNN